MNTKAPQPVRSAEGRIQYLLMAFDGTYQEEYFTILLELLQKMPYWTRFIVCCREEEWRLQIADFLQANQFHDYLEVFANARGAFLPRCLLISPSFNKDRKDYSVWARDAFVPHWDQRSRTIQISAINSEGDMLRKDLVASKDATVPYIEYKDTYIDLGIEGGNLLLVDKYILVGYPELEDNKKWADLKMEQLAVEKEIIANRLMQLFNEGNERAFERVIFVGETAMEEIRELMHALGRLFDPKNAETYNSLLLNHLDMFLSPIGTKHADGKPTLLLARAEALISLGSASNFASDILRRFNVFLYCIELELQQYFHILRNPAPLFVKYAAEEKAGLHSAKPIGLYLGSYNNCIVECSGSSKKVWLPKISIAPAYGLHQKCMNEIEEKNRETWMLLGFEVFFIEANFHPFLSLIGGLHCLTLDMGRAE